MSTTTILFNISSFIAGLFLLERGADLFTDNTAALARHLKLPDVLIALLTAGAEWEELAVVVLSLAQNRPHLAIGNVVGSCISNILGAFSLGLMFQSTGGVFDRSSKLYTLILFGVTSAVAILSIFKLLGKATGIILILAFIAYIFLVCWSIYRGILSAPEDSDSDSDSDSDAASEHYPEIFDDETIATSTDDHQCADESAPLFPKDSKKRRRLSHLAKLLLGFLALLVSGFVLSHSSTNLAQAAGISDAIFGATILSFATTLPEKFVAVLSGSRGHAGILIANTVGSNIFLLTLCLGIVLTSSTAVDIASISLSEVLWMWGASALLLFAVFINRFRLFVAIVMLTAYLAFIVLEFTLFRS